MAFGDYGLKVTEPGWITDRQIEAARVAITRFVKRSGRVWIRIFPDKPVTKKPQETRMGKGKGSPELWVARGQTRSHSLRDGGCYRGAGARGDAFGRAQTSAPDEVRLCGSRRV